MARRARNIYKRKDGRWEGRYIKERINGKAKYAAVYARTYTEVKEKLEKAKDELKKKQIPICKAGSVTDMGQKWLAEVSADLKESSIVKYEDLLRCYIYPGLGNTDLSDITNDQLMNFATDLKKNGGKSGQGLSGSTVSEVVSVMAGLRGYALRHGYSVVFTTDCVSIRQQRGDIRVFSIEEEDRLVSWLLSHMDETALGVYTALFTGIRIGELCAMTWDYIDMEAKTMRIGHTMQRIRSNTSDGKKTEVKIFEPKSIHSLRTIPLPNCLIPLFMSYHVPGAYLLTGKKDKFVEPRIMHNRFKKILDSCDIKDASFHACRHSFATRCIELGFDVKSLSEILGHSNVAFTMNRYVHPSMAHKAENMNMLNDLFK